jgi:hypothetical protein
VKPQVSFKALPMAARMAVILFGLFGLAALLYAVSLQPTFASGRLVILLGIAIVSARAKVNLYKGSTISFLTCIVLLAVIREGPAIAVLLAVCGVTVQTLFPSRKVVLHQLAFNAGMIALTVVATWWTYGFIARTQAIDTLSGELTATILASFMYFLGNSISVSLIVSLSQKISMVHIWSQHFLYSAPSFLIAGLLSLGVTGLKSTHFLLIATALIGVVFLAYYCSLKFVNGRIHESSDSAS